MQCHKIAAQCCKNLFYIVKSGSSLSTAIFDCEIYSNVLMANERLFNVNYQAQLGKISQPKQHANCAFSTNMLGHTVVG